MPYDHYVDVCFASAPKEETVLFSLPPTVLLSLLLKKFRLSGAQNGSDGFG